MYILHVTYTLKPGMAQEFVKAIADAGIDTASRAEDGCRQYDYFYAAQRADQVLLVEIWDSVEAQVLHTQTAHFKALGAIKEAFVLDTAIAKFIGE